MEQTNDQKPKTNSFLVTLLSVLLLISVFIAGFFAYQTQKLVKELTVYRLQPTQTPTPTATPDPTAGWKTYTNTNIGYLLKYPEDWNIPTEKSQQTSFDNTLTITFIAGTTLEKYVTNNLPTDKTPTVDYINGDIYGEKIVYKSGVDQAILDVAIVLPKQSNNVIVFSYTDYAGHITKSETIDQILSTFKFIDPTASSTSRPVACPMDAMRCPDGSSTGRSGPKCEFAPCPTPKN